MWPQFDLQLFGEGEPSAERLHGRVDELSNNVKELNSWKESANTRQTQLETQLRTLPETVAETVAAKVKSGSSDTSPTPTADSLSTATANVPDRSVPRDGSISPPDAIPNPADQHRTDGQPADQPPPNENNAPKQSQRRGFLSRLA